MTLLSANSGFYATVKSGQHKIYNPLMDYKKYSERLKDLQVEQGIKTQIELSRWLGYSRSIVSEWMRGEKIPSMDTAIKIAEKFGCNAQWLLTGDGLKYKTDNAKFIGRIIDITHLSPPRQQEAENFIKFLESQEKTPEKTQNKPLTTETENVGWGGVNSAQAETMRQFQDKNRLRNETVERRIAKSDQVMAGRRWNDMTADYKISGEPVNDQ